MATDKAYQFMDWPRIEALTYGEERFPGRLMAPRPVRGGVLYQCFFPGAKEVFLKNMLTGRKQLMTKEDEAGYFAVVLSGKKVVDHRFIVDGEEKGNPYALPSPADPETIGKFSAGIADRAYKVFGAHVMKIGIDEGVLFVLWAPNAVRVSVVGPFNGWDGLANPMDYDEDSGVYELFIPGLKEGCAYQYELKNSEGHIYTRPDPFGYSFEEGKPVSVVTSLKYNWHDRNYMTCRSMETDSASHPIAIMECAPDFFARNRAENQDIRKTAELLARHAFEMGYTHVELPPVMEFTDESAGGFHTTGYFAPTFRLGDVLSLKNLVDTLHEQGIGVILDWTPAQFSPDSMYLAAFDGTCLYEHLDPRQGIHPMWGTHLFNHGRPEVQSFLLSNAVYWIREYHVDGLRLDGCATMLRLDYGRGDAWVANSFGTNENLEGIAFLKKLTSVIKKEYPDVLMILEESADVPDTTSPVEEDGLGFDFEWNLHFTEEMKAYLALDPDERTAAHQLLENGMLYNFMKKSVLSLSRGIGAFDPGRYLASVGGDENAREGALRAMYGYLFTHPGKKLLASSEETNCPDFLRALIRLYRGEPALYELDFSGDGFEWIRTPSDGDPILAFMRKGKNDSFAVLVICNFTEEICSDLMIGVPYEGRYRELLNSDSEIYGGEGEVNPRTRITKKAMTDERPYTLKLRIGPESVAIFRYEGK